MFNLEDIGTFNYDQPQIVNLLKLINLTTGEHMFPVKAFILDKSTASNWDSLAPGSKDCGGKTSRIARI